MTVRSPHKYDDEDDRQLKAALFNSWVDASDQQVYLCEPNPEVEVAALLGAPEAYTFEAAAAHTFGTASTTYTSIDVVGVSQTYSHDHDFSFIIGHWQTDEPLGITTSGVINVPDRTTQEHPTPPAIVDRDWFYSDPARVEKYAGQYVSVMNQEVVGSGTPQEAYEAAIGAGAEKPFVFRVPTEEDLESAELGL